MLAPTLNSRAMRRACALLLAVVSSTAIAACGSSQSASTSDIAKSIGFNPNRAVYALPLDQIRAIDDGSISYATNLIVQDCMEDAGFAWPIPAFDPSVRPPATWNSIGRRLFDVEIAAQYGYHLAPANAAALRDFALNSRAISGAEQRQLGRCRASAGKRIASPELRLVDSLGGAAYDEALSESDTVEAGRRWASCLAPEGISDLPDMPNRMPSPSVAKRFHLGRQGGTASPEEIELATADARCRESSGYAKTMYDAEVDQQLTLFEKNRYALDRTRAAVKRNLQRARAIVAQHGA